MLWYSIQSKPNDQASFALESRKRVFQNPCRASTFARHLQLDFHLHSGFQYQYFKAAIRERIRTFHFHRRIFFKKIIFELLAFLVIAFIIASLVVSWFILYDAASSQTKRGYGSGLFNQLSRCFEEAAIPCLKSGRLFDPALLHEPACDKKIECPPAESPLAQLPIYWWGLLSLVFLVLVMLIVMLTKNTRLTTIYLYFFASDETFPVVKDVDLQKSCVFAIRVLHPHLLERARDYLDQDSCFSFLGCTENLGPSEIRKMDPQDKHRVGLQFDLAPIARLALAFSLRRPISKRTEVDQESSIEHHVSKSLRFAFKLHLPQITIYLLLVVFSFFTILARPFGDIANSQYLLILSIMGFFWAYLCIHLHHHDMRLLREWDALNVRKPLESSPIYVLDYGQDFSPLWFELRDSDFETGIVEYGIDKQFLLNFLLSVLLMLFFVMLQLTK